MKKELLEELKINPDKKVKRGKIKKYLTTLEALGLATLIGLTRLSTNKILKNKKLLKKIKNGKLLRSIKQRSMIKVASKPISNRKASRA